MSHPFTQRVRFLLIYALVWIILASIQILILWSFREFEASMIIVESLVSNLTFALLGLLAWYPTRYIPFQPQNPFYSLIAHIVAGLFVILVWILVNLGLMNLFFPAQVEYLQFLMDTLFWRVIIGCMIYLVLVLVYYLITYGQKLQERTQQEERLKSLVRESELNALKSQINPHFLFNSLNSISSLTMSNPDEARDMIIKLSDFLRYSLKHREHEYVPLKEEIGRMEDYLSIEKIRFGEKLQYSFDMSKDCEEVKVPTMILQPLFENAIKHGVYESVKQVHIDFICKPENSYLKILIRNDFDPEFPGRKGTGIGLQNVRQRIELSYEDTGLVKWSSKDGEFIVTLLIPRTKIGDYDTH